MTQTAIPTSIDYWQKLDTFRESYPLCSVTIQNCNWTAYDTGGSAFVLLLLHGGGGHAEAMFPQIVALAQYYRVIVPNIPPEIRTVSAVIDGLSTLLNALGIDRFHLYGVSLGGHIAQIFIRKHFSRVGSMVLSHTAIPCEHLAQKTLMQYRILQLYPSRILIRMFKHMTRDKIAKSPINLTIQEREFWQGYFDSQYDSAIDKAHIVARAAIMGDYFRNYTFHSSDLNYWDGRILIIESSDDEVYEEGDRGALVAMYSRSWIHTFEGYTHLATILAHQQSAELVADFLKGDAYDRV